MKDAALSPGAELMEKLPIAVPSAEIRSQIEPVVAWLISLTEHDQASTRDALVWLAAEFGVTTPR